MVSLAHRLALATLAEEDVHLRVLKQLLDGDACNNITFVGHDVRGLLLEAIATGKQDEFKELALEIGKRKISIDSDWCHDDYLIFLLLLGNEKFGHPITFLKSVLEVRQVNANATPRKINEVFSAIDRQEYGMEGEFGFLKIPFLFLIGKLKLTTTDASKIFKELSAVIEFEKLAPFIQLLTQKAYDLLLTERQPLAIETVEQVIEGFEKHAKDLTFRQWRAVIFTLPGRILWGIAVAVVSLGLIPFLFGIGQKVVELHSTQPRSRPQRLEVADVSAVPNTLPSELQKFSKLLPNNSVGKGNHIEVVFLQCKPFAEDTPSFIVEVSNRNKAIQDIVAFAQTETSGERAFTVIPFEYDSGRIRILMPERLKGEQLCLLIAYSLSQGDDAIILGHQAILRSLQ